MKIRFVWILLIGHLALLPLPGTAASLYFRGNDNFPDHSLAKRLFQKGLDIELAAGWTSEQMGRAERLVKVYYQDRGYPLSSVQFQQSSGRSTLTVLEGPRTKLTNISFEGNSAFSHDRLIRLFKLGKWFNQGDVDTSLKGIRRLYKDEGYIHIQVQTDPLKISVQENTSYFPIPFRSGGSNCASLTCRISEGNRYHFGKVSFSEGFEPRDIEVPETGNVFREHRLISLRESIVGQLEQDGRLVRELQILQNVNQPARCVDIQVTVEAYPILLIRSIEFAGNCNFPDSFYRRELEVDEKRMFHPLDLRQSLRRLAETGTLSALSAEDVELTVDERTLEVDILFHLSERERQGIRYSFGPGQYGGLDASLAYSILNLLGLGEALGINASAGPAATGIAVEFASRYFIGTNLPVSMALRFFSQHSGLRLPGIDDNILGLLGIRETGVSGQFEYRVHSDKSTGITASLANRETGTRQLTFSPYLRKQDNLIIAQRSSSLWGTDRSWNLRPSFGWTQQAGEGLKFRVTGSHAFFFGAQEPISERLFIGPSTVRGFSLSGPLALVGETPALVGGDTSLALNSEYRVRLAQPVSMAPFLDIGWSGILSGSNEYEILGNSHKLLRCSTGSELRVKLPRFPEVRLVFSWNPLRFDPEPSLAKFREPSFNFRVGFNR